MFDKKHSEFNVLFELISEPSSEDVRIAIKDTDDIAAASEEIQDLMNFVEQYQETDYKTYTRS